MPCENLQQWLGEATSQILRGWSQRDEAIEYLTKQLRRCRAKSKRRFWQWLRIQLAKSQYAALLTHIKEPAESAPESPDAEPFSYVQNGDVALISVGPAVWKVPMTRLDFVRSVWPVFARELPALEPPERRKIRDLKAQLKAQSWKMLPAMRTQIQDEIKRWEGILQRSETLNPVARYGMFKSVNGSEVAVHRRYLNAGRFEDVSAMDGDLTNFCPVKFRVTAEPLFFSDAAIIPGNANPRCPERLEQDVFVPNLYIVQSEDNPNFGHDYDLQDELKTDYRFENMAAGYQQDRLEANAVRQLAKAWGTRK